MANQAPNMGPRVKQSENAIPTRARDFARLAGSETSLITAILSCTFPSESPPTARDSTYGPKLVEVNQRDAERMLPNIVNNKTGLRPYLSDSLPMTGEIRN